MRYNYNSSSLSEREATIQKEEEMMRRINIRTLNFSESSPTVRMVIGILAHHRDREGLDAKERFLLEYARLIAKYRLAVISQRDITSFWLPIELKAQVGEKLGFSAEEIREVTSHIRDTYRTEVSLDKLVKQLGEEKE